MQPKRATELAKQLKTGDIDALRELVPGLTRTLIARAYRYTGDWESARDLTQDTWITVHEQIGRYDPARDFLPWLHTIHRNGCLSHLRRLAVRKEMSLEAEIDEPASPDAESNPATSLNRREFGERLLAAMGRLSVSQRRVFALVDVERTEQAEAAELLGMKFSTLRTTLHFARSRLAAALSRWKEEWL